MLHAGLFLSVFKKKRVVKWLRPSEYNAVYLSKNHSQGPSEF